ncbi:hypothetical protein DN745_02925 [Bradymonas sediminis]|uniref:Uncharacterized protein n=2 Tax=Bradymonas sediminis TaxID=1548548 RepID=A0A2Z4FHI1_9DELT|nr:hypothetical protein DN745_02925 [Bradymonas sediminis]
MAAALVMLAAGLIGAGCHRATASSRPAHHQQPESRDCDPRFMQILNDAEAPDPSENPTRRAHRERAMQDTHRTARKRAEDWLQLAEYQAASLPGAPAMALLSFPQATTSISRRSYLYDNALALLWYAWKGQYSRARALAQTLRYLQLEDGSWGYSFHLDNPQDHHARYIRSGAVAWAAHALAYFGTQFGEPAALLSAQRAARFLESMRLGGSGPTRGLVSAGRGLPSTLMEAPPSPKLGFAVSEHQFDAHIVLARFFPMQAERLAEQMLDVLWLKRPGRFAVAAGAERVDTRRALDAAGAWGALWLLGAGHPQLAAQSYRYSRETFASSALLVGHAKHGPVTLKLQGFRPYEDDIDGYDVDAAADHIFVEGAMGMGIAAHRLGDPETAQKMLRTGIALSCTGAPGIPYSTVQLPGFSTHAAAAPTLWFLFLEREMATGRDAPIFSASTTPSLTF